MRHTGSRGGSLVLTAAALLAGAAAAAAQDAGPSPPAARAVALEQAPALDGDVLGDAAWQAVEPVTEFWQTTPDEGHSASERTEVRIGYTREALYVAIVCHDREPDKLVVTDSRRDGALDAGDSFRLVLDTHLDRQNGFVFGTNPAGMEYDGQVTIEGAGGGGGFRSLGGYNQNWDAAWRVRTLVGPFGWSAEFEIPFRSLRYGRGATQSWGLNLERVIRRRNERAYWARLPRQHDLFRLSAAGILEGVQPPPQRNLSLTPYALGEARRVAGDPDPDRVSGDVGGDLKYSLTPSLTLDLTVNTDFAQVEADEQQINLDRFSLFFPEKRPFFLENAGFFSVGNPGEVELFFSRRIGIGPEGQVIPILGGARLSGKAGGFNVGLLDMQTRAVAGVAPANNFAVGRLYRELPNRSAVGLVVINRQGMGEHARADDHNRTVGLDARWGVGPHLDLAAYAARTFTPGLGGSEHAWHVSSSWRSPAWLIQARYTDVGEQFRPEVGFTTRRGYRKPDLLVFHTHRFASAPLGLLEARPHVSYRGFWKPDGFQESGFLHVDNHLEWRSGWEFHTGVNVTREGLRRPFEIHPGIVVPPGTYDNAELQLVARTPERGRLGGEMQVNAGGFFDGTRVAVTSELGLRLGERLKAEVDWSRNDVSLRAGRFTTNLVRGRLSCTFTPRLYLQALVQYNDRIRNWSTNLRLGWLQAANAGLFLVYNENRATSGWGTRDRSLVLKFSRLVDLLD